VERGEIERKKKSKERVEKREGGDEKVEDPFDALIKNTGLNLKVNEEELKRLLASEPKIEEQEIPRVSLEKIFDPFRWNRI
jgi:hypothetical protein